MELKLHGNRKTSNIERLISEARLLKSLKAEYIIKFYDFWIDDEKKNLNLITVIFVSVSLSQYCKKHKGVTTKAIKNWARQILRDTAVSVAEEMAVQLELSPEDEAYNSELIETLVMKLVPGWKTSCGSIASAPEWHPDCLQSVRDEEALQSINPEISSEHGVTISSCAELTSIWDPSHCSLPLSIRNLGSDPRMVDDGRLSEHKKSARNFVGSRFPSCFGMKCRRAFPASAIHTKQKN
ncbi:serine/threonine-protein kinase [Salix suchowensis]|nr:serine/threonine-protein kinase [Salix suchowensis]